MLLLHHQEWLAAGIVLLIIGIGLWFACQEDYREVAVTVPRPLEVELRAIRRSERASLVFIMVGVGIILVATLPIPYLVAIAIIIALFSIGWVLDPLTHN